MKREYKLFLEDIIKSCEYIQEFVEGIDFDQFLNDEKTSSAVIQKFGIIGEAVKNIPEFIKQKYPDIAWKDMSGMLRIGREKAGAFSRRSSRAMAIGD